MPTNAWLKRFFIKILSHFSPTKFCKRLNINYPENVTFFSSLCWRLRHRNLILYFQLILSFRRRKNVLMFFPLSIADRFRRSSINVLGRAKRRTLRMTITIGKIVKSVAHLFRDGSFKTLGLPLTLFSIFGTKEKSLFWWSHSIKFR